MNPVEAAELVGMIAIAFPTPAWEDPTLKLWQRMLLDLEVEPATDVVEDWIRTRDDRPSIAAVRRGVADRQFRRDDGAKLFLPPDEAWEYVQRCFGSVGQYAKDGFPSDHPLVKEAVDRMGWVAMCQSDNVSVIRGQFRVAYTALLDRSLAETAASEGAASPPSDVADLALEHRPVKQIGARA